MDRSQVLILRDWLTDHLDAFRRETGLDVKLGKGQYTDSNVVFQLILSEVSDGGKVMTPEASKFKAQCEKYNLHPSELFQKFSWHGRTFTVVGLNTRKRRRPVMCRRDDGTPFSFPAEAVRTALDYYGVAP